MPTKGNYSIHCKRSNWTAKKKRCQMSKSELIECLKSKEKGGYVNEAKEV